MAAGRELAGFHEHCLPSAEVEASIRYDLDLSAANLEYLDLTRRQIGQLTARRARLHGISRLSGIRVHQPALFSDVIFYGRTDLYSASFDGGLSLLRAQFGGMLEIPQATVRNFVDLRTTTPKQQIGVLVILDQAVVKLGEDTGWAVQYDNSAEGGANAGATQRT